MVTFINKKDTKDKLIGDLWESFNSCVIYKNNPILHKSYILMSYISRNNNNNRYIIIIIDSNIDYNYYVYSSNKYKEGKIKNININIKLI